MESDRLFLKKISLERTSLWAESLKEKGKGVQPPTQNSREKGFTPITWRTSYVYLAAWREVEGLSHVIGIHRAMGWLQQPAASVRRPQPENFSIPRVGRSKDAWAFSLNQIPNFTKPQFPHLKGKYYKQLSHRFVVSDEVIQTTERNSIGLSCIPRTKAS